MKLWMVRRDGGAWERPSDPAEAREWALEQADVVAGRGRFSCTYQPWRGDCTRRIGQCCEGGRWRARPRWVIVDVLTGKGAGVTR